MQTRTNANTGNNIKTSTHTTLAWYEDALQPLASLSLSVLDRGVLFGDGLYDVMPALDHSLIAPKAHGVRLFESLKQLDYPLDFIQKVERTFIACNQKVMEANAHFGDYFGLYTQITRGAGSVRTHLPSGEEMPSFLIFPQRYHPFPQTCTLKVIEDVRWRLGHYKTTANLASVLMLKDAKQSGADEALLVHQGFVREAATSNIIIIKNKTLYTPPYDGSIFPGITALLVQTLAHDLNLEFIQTPITLETLKNADEVWITGALKGICPCREILLNEGTHPIGNGVYPLAACMQSRYAQHAKTLEPLSLEPFTHNPYQKRQKHTSKHPQKNNLGGTDA